MKSLTFAELYHRWTHGHLTLEEAVGHTMNALLLFQEHATRVELKALPHQMREGNPFFLSDDLPPDPDIASLMRDLKGDKSALYRAMDLILDRYMAMEFALTEVELQYDALNRRLDDTQSHWN